MLGAKSNGLANGIKRFGAWLEAIDVRSWNPNRPHRVLHVYGNEEDFGTWILGTRRAREESSTLR
ncbi:MAG: hypothetical protein V3V08_02175 [Nannocystaceae bacterium]